MSLEKKNESDKPPDVSKYSTAKEFTELAITEVKEFIEKVNVILVTATDIERNAVIDATEPTGDDGKYIKVITSKGSANFILGKYGPCNVAIMTCQGPNKKTDTILTLVLNDVKAKYVIAIGTCYGAKESRTTELSDKTKLGDIIVAESIVDTEQQRIEGKEEIHILPDTYKCGETLLNIFKHDEVFKFERKFVKVHVGVLVSEFTQHNSEEKKQELFKYIPQALGGEMEANGINRVAEREKFEEKFEWIVIKAIVDWGNKNKDEDWEKFGAVSCARFVRQCLEEQPEEGDPLKKASKLSKVD